MRPPGTLAPTHAQVSHLAQLRKAHIDKATRTERAEIERLLSQTEHFVFTALPLRDDEEVLASAKAMQEADVWHLPFSICTFEFSALITVGAIEPNPGQASRFILICHEGTDAPEAMFLFCRARQHVWIRVPLTTEEAWNALGEGELAPPGYARLTIDTLKGYNNAADIAGACLVMLATRGIRRERWSGDRPVLKNRPEPRDAYTKVLVREASEEQGHSDAHGGATDRCRVRLHLRRGHIRHQPVGPRSAGQTRMIWIAPMLVGYAEEGTIEHTHYERRPTPA